MPPRKRAAPEATYFIDLTGDDGQPAYKRPALSSSQSGGSSVAASRQRTQAIPSSSSFQLSTQEPDYLDLTQEDDTFDRELYGTFSSSASPSITLIYH